MISSVKGHCSAIASKACDAAALRRCGLGRKVAGAGLTMLMCAGPMLTLLPGQAQAQSTAPPVPAVSAVPPTSVAASTSTSTPTVVPPAAQTAPRYSAKDAKLAFGFLDANSDGRISREEAAQAKNVAKYFDQADVNRDKGLSLQEFTAALNKAKVL